MSVLVKSPPAAVVPLPPSPPHSDYQDQEDTSIPLVSPLQLHNQPHPQPMKSHFDITPPLALQADPHRLQFFASDEAAGYEVDGDQGSPMSDNTPLAHSVPALATHYSEPDRVPQAKTESVVADPRPKADRTRKTYQHHQRGWSSMSTSASTRGNEQSGVKGAKLEDFELVRVLGKGVAGRVLLVRHSASRSIRAMKAISKRTVFAHDELDHTLAELNILKRLALSADPVTNRFATRLHYAFTDKENFYFVMDFYPGGDLATQMEIHGILGPVRTRFYSVDIVEGLEALHRQGIVVRDLKPENILLNEHGHAVLADFGLSKEFGYRGEPQPVHVVRHPKREPLPEWAGAGAGSLRTMHDGRRRVVVDYAHSFVGTAEYLSPEVIQLGEYSYSVDWWALGCIIIEGLTGRVPFRRSEDEPLMALYDRILYEPWDDVFNQPVVRRHTPESLGFDRATYEFVTALMEKDPVRRLSEPYIKPHAYFWGIEWDTVREGGYDDPYPLNLHSTDEYDSRYFPKLCLEEPASVDMSTHESRHSTPIADHLKTPLNDNDLYALAQAVNRDKLAAFTWTRPSHWFDEDVGKTEVVVRHEADEDEVEVGNVIPPDHERNESDEVEIDQGVETEAEVESGLEGEAEGEAEIREVIRTPEGSSSEDVTPIVQVTNLLSMDDPAVVANSPEGMGSDSLPLPKAIHTSPGSRGPPLPMVPPRSPSLGIFDLSPSPVPVSPHGAASTPTQPVPIGKRPAPLHSLSISPPSRADAERERERQIPLGLPAGGISVSDLISIPSPSADGRNLIIRRQHPTLHANGNNGNTPTSPPSRAHARLSVELNGTIAQLDDEWEELEMDPNGPEAPNGTGENGGSGGQGHFPPSSFFSRGLGTVLRRRTSGLGGVSLSLRRQQQYQQLQQQRDQQAQSHGQGQGQGQHQRQSPVSSREASPTKSRHQLFTARSIESTKKALATRFKAFPGRKVSESSEDPTGGGRRSPTKITKIISGPNASTSSMASVSTATSMTTSTLGRAVTPTAIGTAMAGRRVPGTPALATTGSVGSTGPSGGSGKAVSIETDPPREGKPRGGAKNKEKTSNSTPASPTRTGPGPPGLAKMRSITNPFGGDREFSSALLFGRRARSRSRPAGEGRKVRRAKGSDADGEGEGDADGQREGGERRGEGEGKENVYIGYSGFSGGLVKKASRKVGKWKGKESDEVGVLEDGEGRKGEEKTSGAIGESGEGEEVGGSGGRVPPRVEVEVGPPVDWDLDRGVGDGEGAVTRV